MIPEKLYMKKILIVFLLAFANISLSIAQETKFFDGSFIDALSKAKAENKLLLVDCYFEGCMPCKEMETRVFPAPGIGNYLNTNFVAWKTDVFKEEEGKLVAAKYGITGFPSYIMLDGSGKVVNITIGFTSEKKFLPILQASVADAKSGNVKNFTSSLKMEFPSFYWDYRKTDHKFDKEACYKYFDAQVDWNNEVNFILLTAMPLNEKYTEIYLSNADLFAKNYSRMMVRNKILGIMQSKAKKMAVSNDAVAFDDMKNRYKTIFADEWTRFDKIFTEVFYNANKDYSAFVKYVKNNPAYDSDDRISFANSLMQTNKDDKAVLEALPALFLEKDNTVRGFDYNYTMAVIYFKLNQIEKAGLYVKAALKFNSKQNELANANNMLQALESPERSKIYRPIGLMSGCKR